MGDVRFLAHALQRRAARARLDELRRSRGQTDQGTPEGEPVREQQDQENNR